MNQLRATTSLTKQIEADISYNAWDRQMRLSFKRDLYVRLLETMGEKIRTLRNVIYVETMLANLTLDQSRREDWKQKLREFYTTNDLLSSKFQTVASVAGISIPADARQVLDALAAESQRLARENMTDAQKTNIQKAEEEAMLFLEAFNQMGFFAKRDVGDME